VLHAHFTLPGGLIGAITRKITSTPLIVTVHGYDTTCIRNIGYGLICNPFLRKIVKKTLNGTNKIIAVSNSVKKRINQLGVKDDKLRVIYNGIDLKKFCLSNEIIEKSKILKDNKNWTNKRILLNVGSLVPVKGQRYLIEAMRDVIKEFSDSILLICGDGPLKGALHELVINFELQDYVKFMGTIQPKDILLYYAIADVFLLSSIMEGHPISLLEAMAYSKPIVATKVGGIPETIKTQRNGLLVEKQSPKKLAEAICTVLRDKKLAEAIRRNAGNSIKKYSLNIQAKQMLAVYKELKNAK
jgi:glycosyltransferase involved in cell wall biosynthesis